MTLYIQRRGDGYLETVSENSQGRRATRSELAEYRRSDPSAAYYISRRPCRDWAEATKAAAAERAAV